jgi:two-component system, chemotaxis family, chemotaxis protein CheY
MTTLLPDFDLSRLSFLIVDDNHHMISILREVLRAFGATQIHGVRDAADAFELSRTTPIDIAIVDYLMEPLDGLDFIRLIRSASDSPAPELPIILLTAHTEWQRVEGARDAGATDVVQKPVSAALLYQRIQTLLKSNRRFINSNHYIGPCRRRTKREEFYGTDRREGR